MDRKTFTKGISFFLLFFSVFGPGNETDTSKKTSAQLKAWLTSAKKGDESKYLSLFSAYCKGEGVQKDKTEAAKWFKKYQESELKKFNERPGPKGKFDRAWSTPVWLEEGCDVGSIQ